VNKCVVCGADVSKSRHMRREYVGKSNTCDPICTRAKHSGRTREEQQWADDFYDVKNSLDKSWEKAQETAL
jgi:hypothetical protein